MTLEELKRLESAATPGPWVENRHGYDSYYTAHTFLENEGTPVCGVWAPEDHAEQRANAALIAAMRNALTDLIAAVEALRDMVRGPNEGCIQPADARALLSRLGVE